MRPSSAKAKGRRLQQELRDAILAAFPHLTPDDVRSTSMGASGEDTLLSPAARAAFPFASECKNQEALNIWKALEQAEANADPAAGKYPLLVFRRNRTRPWAAVPLEVLFLVLKTGAAPTQATCSHTPNCFERVDEPGPCDGVIEWLGRPR